MEQVQLEQLSPMMQQYMKTKEENGDCILFYRLGDFYEMFFDDAVTVSRELELTLTGKECGLKERAPMCGVPYHALDTYLNRLVQKGYRVAIAEQMEDPRLAKGLVKREVVRIVTPGTIISDLALDEAKNNYLMCIVYIDRTFGLGVADISTGDFHVTEVEDVYKRQLLTASSRERTQIFRNIFRTRIYDAIQNVLASRAKEMLADIGRLKTQCDEVVQSVRSDDENWKTACSLKDKNYSALLRMAEEALAQDRRLLKNLDARTERLEASVRRLMLRTDAARELNLKIDRYHECCQKLAQLRQEEARAKRARKQLDASSRFLKAKPAFEALNSARMRLKEAEASRLQAERTLAGLNREFAKKQQEQQRAPKRAALLAQLEEKLRRQKLMEEKCLELMKREAELKQRQDIYLKLEEEMCIRDRESVL